MPTADELKFIYENKDFLDPPENWSPVENPSVVEKHVLQPGSAELKKVEDAFLKMPDGSRNLSAKIVKVERTQNLAMHQSYVVKRQTICQRETKKSGAVDDQAQKQKQIERFERVYLFHGTHVEGVDKILNQGFNRSFCGRNATFYGRGVYFAKHASYSSDSTYAVPDRNGFQYVMLCRVIIGEYCLGQRDALTPDVRDSDTNTLYDSTVDNLKNPSVFVTYHGEFVYCRQVMVLSMPPQVRGY